MAKDEDLIMRIAACAATEGVSLNPTAWADTHRQRLIASTGWAEAYQSAIADENPAPGEDPSVITDEMILAAVNEHVAVLAAAAAADAEAAAATYTPIE